MKYALFRTLLLLFLLLFFGCNNQDAKITQEILSNDSLKNSLLGKWGGPGESRPVWEIKKDSIYYYSEDRSYPFIISKGNLVFKRLNYSVELKNIHVNGDTLFFVDDHGLRIKGYRFVQ